MSRRGNGAPPTATTRASTPNPITNVLIVGAGPVGLALANELSRHNLSVRLIEKSLTRSPYSKAFGLHARTMELFLSLGLAPAILKKCMSTDRIRIKGPLGLESVLKLDSIQSRFKGVFMLSQASIEETLEQHFQDVYGGMIERSLQMVSVIQGEKADAVEGGVHVRVRNMRIGEEETIRCNYVVGCDGAHSTTRSLMKIPFEGIAYPEDFILADVPVRTTTGKPVSHYAPCIIMGSPFFAAFEIKPGVIRVVTKIDEEEVKEERKKEVETKSATAPSAINGSGTNNNTPPPSAVNGKEKKEKQASKEKDEKQEQSVGHEERTPPSLDLFRALLKDRLPELEIDGEGDEVAEWLASFRIHRRVVPSYRAGRVFLAGDSAHIHSPVGGQGLNTGIQDACNLAWKLALVHHGKIKNPDSFLDFYHAERHPVGISTLAMTDAASNLLFFGGWVGKMVRNYVLPMAVPIVSSFSYISHKFASGMTMLSVNYRESPMVAEHGSFPSDSPHPGDRAPDGPVVQTLTGQRTGILEATSHGYQHTLLLFGDEDEKAESPAHGGEESRQDDVAAGLVDLLKRYGELIMVVHVTRRYYTAGGGMEVLLDEDGRVTEAYSGGVGVKKWKKGCAPSQFYYLVRPDGYIAFRSSGWRMTPLKDYMERLYVGRML